MLRCWADMAEDDSSSVRKGSWWHTLPGMLTAAAGFITALTALIVTLSGLLGDSAEPPASNTRGVVERAAGTTIKSTEAAATATFEPEQAATYDVAFPRGTRATGEQLVYDLRGATAERRNPGELTLAITVRVTNTRDYDDNFWDSLFRLRVGDVKRAPISGLNEIVASDSSMDGVVEFVVPDAPGTHTLVIEGKFELPIKLRRH